MDFVGPLPTTARQADMVMVVVDRLSRMAIFIPCRPDIDILPAEQAGELLMHHVFSKHGFPVSVLPDRELQFTAAWLQSLCRLIGTKQMLTTACHPQTNGQTERVNRTLTEVLGHLVNDTSYDTGTCICHWWNLRITMQRICPLVCPPSSHAMARLHALPWSCQRCCLVT